MRLTSTFALIAAGFAAFTVAPGGAAANGIGVLLFFPMAFLAGLMLPKEMMPERIARLGEFTPLGAFRQTLQDAWMGSSPEPLQHGFGVRAAKSEDGLIWVGDRQDLSTRFVSRRQRRPAYPAWPAWR